MQRSTDELLFDPQIPSTVTRNQDSMLVTMWIGWRLFLLGSFLINLLVIVFGSLIYAHNAQLACSPQLSQWLLGQIIISAVSIIVAVLVFVTLPSIYDDPVRAMLRAQRLTYIYAATRIVSLGASVWLIVGLYWIGASAESSICKPDYIREAVLSFVFAYCVVLILAGTLATCAPCFLTILMAHLFGEDYVEERLPPGSLAHRSLGMSLSLNNNNNNNSQNTQSNWQHLHQFMVKHNASQYESEICAVCQSVLSSELYLLTACSHRFHSECIQQAVQYSAYCPSCRTLITSGNQQYVRLPVSQERQESLFSSVIDIKDEVETPYTPARQQQYFKANRTGIIREFDDPYPSTPSQSSTSSLSSGDDSLQSNTYSIKEMLEE